MQVNEAIFVAVATAIVQIIAVGMAGGVIFLLAALASERLASWLYRSGRAVCWLLGEVLVMAIAGILAVATISIDDDKP